MLIAAALAVTLAFVLGHFALAFTGHVLVTLVILI
jgi:hypothetical protein